MLPLPHMLQMLLCAVAQNLVQRSDQRSVDPRLGRLALALADEIEERYGGFERARDDAKTHVGAAGVSALLELVDDGRGAVVLVEASRHPELRLQTLRAVVARRQGEVLVHLDAADGEVGLGRQCGRDTDQEVIVLDVRSFLVLLEGESVHPHLGVAVEILCVFEATETRLDGVDSLVAFDGHVDVETNVHRHLLFECFIIRCELVRCGADGAQCCAAARS